MSRTSLVPVHGSQPTRRPAVERPSHRHHQAVRDLRDSPTQDGWMFAVGSLRRDCLHRPLQVPCHKPVPLPAGADFEALATGEAFILLALPGTGDMMTDCQISLLNSDGHTVNSLKARCADNQEALGLAQRMLDGRGHADVWAGTRRFGRMSEASDAVVKAVGQPWAFQPFKQA